MTRNQKGGVPFRRAVGELAVIVAGVLIALSADQWWASRSDARIEAVYLAGMLDDIDVTLGELSSQTTRTQRYLAAAAELSRLPRSSPGISEDSLTVLVADALFNLVTWDSRLSTLDDLRSTGRLGLISNAEIRRGLAEIERLTSGIQGAEDDLLQTQHQTLDPYLVRHTDLPALVPKTLPEVSRYLGPPTGISLAPLVGDPEFRNLVALRVVLLRNLDEAYVRMRDHLVGLSDLIREAEVTSETGQNPGA